MGNIEENNTEATILEAAKRVFLRKGLFGARMQEIANDAGINKALLHYYYRSKQKLFEAVFKQAFGLMAPRINNVLNSDLELEDKIISLTQNYISFVIKHPYLPSFVIQELNSNPDFVATLISEDHFPNITVFRNQVNQLVAAEKIKPIDPNQLFINVISLTIFPFIAAPLLKGFTRLDDKAYKQLIEDRKVEVSNFIINAIKIEK
ncbi:MAG: TetR/AcrR family transcriptional regulator [Bacteroidetes bacterium]|nr:MAG: TetR/AcrR family transcriptional regulator [Bacteroidota bacterium]MBL1145058.1 TetR/AcrR family transcriptional regulator [Bacteroidota bacterium]MCB0801662.1 TetR/AcrR family transcriptional regulator [Flavobacteriales bacterium]NOG57855.1 TetR/AcrR family transcriptional regulator [Bacteroidota bacterium]